MSSFCLSLTVLLIPALLYPVVVTARGAQVQDPVVSSNTNNAESSQEAEEAEVAQKAEVRAQGKPQVEASVQSGRAEPGEASAAVAGTAGASKAEAEARAEKEEDAYASDTDDAATEEDPLDEEEEDVLREENVLLSFNIMDKLQPEVYPVLLAWEYVYSSLAKIVLNRTDFDFGNNIFVFDAVGNKAKEEQHIIVCTAKSRKNKDEFVKECAGCLNGKMKLFKSRAGKHGSLYVSCYERVGGRDYGCAFGKQPPSDVRNMKMPYLLEHARA